MHYNSQTTPDIMTFKKHLHLLVKYGTGDLVGTYYHKEAFKLRNKDENQCDEYAEKVIKEIDEKNEEVLFCIREEISESFKGISINNRQIVMLEKKTDQYKAE